MNINNLFLTFFLFVLSMVRAQTGIEITGDLVIQDYYENANITIEGKTDLHLTAKENPLINSKVYLNSTDSWLFFDNLRPTEVLQKYASNIFVNNVPFKHKVNGRISIYKHGTIIVPHNGGENFEALEVFTNENFSGNSNKYKLYTINNNLGAFNNVISSFKLKRGYSVVFANNEDGTGFSRVFVADSEDLEIPLLPTELNNFVSFIRVSYWQYPSKKGLCNKLRETNNETGITRGENQMNLTQSTWYYSWGDQSPDFLDYEFVTMKWGGGNTDSNLQSKVVSHFLGYNEPDAPNQSNLTVERAIELWPGLLKSGLRLGSPSPVNPTAHEDWLGRFMAEAERLNYRVDYIALHCYWEQPPETWYSKLKEVHDRYKRPIWITEGHTKAGYPYGWKSGDSLTAQQITRLGRLKDVVKMLDTIPWVERYSMYNWDTEGDVFVTGDYSETENTQRLTPTGEFYRDNLAPYFYAPEEEYVFNYKLNYDIELSSEILDNNTQVQLSWNEINDELVTISVERKRISETEFKEIASLKNTSFYIDDIYDGASYRIRLTLITDETNKISNQINVNAYDIPATPILTGKSLSTQIIQLGWESIAGARTYSIQRSTRIDSGYEIIANDFDLTNFTDENLAENTTYYYQIAATNYAGTSQFSSPLAMATKQLEVPGKVSGISPEAGSGKVRLDWNMLFDATYVVKRAESPFGPFTTIATEITNPVYFDTGLLNGTTYYYMVSASNKAGNGANSVTVSATPYIGPVAFWNFNEGQGTTSLDKINNQVATLNSWSSEGKTSAGAYFDGTRESYVTMPIGILENIDDFTITTWINMAVIPEEARLFDFRSERRIYMEMILNDGNNTMSFVIRNYDNSNTLNVEYIVPKNKWIHLAITQASGFTSIYADGELLGSMQFTLKPSGMGRTSLNYLNKANNENLPNLTGVIDEFNIYEIAMGQQEIVNEMNKINYLVEESDVVNDPDLEIKVYPNPVSKQINFKGKLLIESDIVAELYNINGQKIKTKVIDSGSNEKFLNVSDISKGLYFLKISCGSISRLNKILIE